MLILIVEISHGFFFFSAHGWICSNNVTTVSNNIRTIKLLRKLNVLVIITAALEYIHIPAVFFNHILALFMMEFMVVIPTSDPHWHGDNVDTDLLDQQHTNTQTDIVTNKVDSHFQIRPATQWYKHKGCRSSSLCWGAFGISGNAASYAFFLWIDDCALQQYVTTIMSNSFVFAALMPSEGVGLLYFGHCHAPKHSSILASSGMTRRHHIDLTALQTHL